MNRFSKRAAALALALVLGASPAASASVALGDDIRSHTVTLSQNTDLTTGVFWSNTYSDLRTERYLTYTPNTTVTPVVSYGDKVIGKSTLSAMAKTLEAAGSRVVGGVNGDYFVVATGVPCGLLVTDGVLRSSDAALYGVGFNADGTVFVGQPKLSVTATFAGHTLIVAAINKVRTATGGYFLLTDDFSSTTQNSEAGVDVILVPVTDEVGQPVQVNLEVDDPVAQAAADTAQTSAATAEEAAPAAITAGAGASAETLVQAAKPTVGGRVTYIVEQVLQSSGSIEIPAGKAVLTINNKSNAWLVSELSALQPGDRVELDVTSEEDRWTQADYAVGAMYKLVTNGAVESGLDANQYPRSAVGVKADGTAVFYTIDGRQTDYSVGATLTQVASRLVELGCVEAVCLDGGGSTTIGVTYPDQSASSVINKPSDGTQRAIGNAVFLVSKLSATGTLGSLYVTPGNALLLPGATLQLAAAGVDTAWYPMTLSSSVTWSLQSGGGSVSSSGLFTGGTAAGVSSVKAAAGAAVGSVTVSVISKPDTILLYNEATGAAVTSLSLSPGQAMDLKASAFYRKLDVTAQDTCFTWQAEGAGGTVDQNGLFTAADKTGTGSLVVSAGGRSVTIPVTVTGHVLPLEDFEQEALTSFVSTETADVSLHSGADLVRYGTQSMRLNYDASSGVAAAATFLNITAGEKYLNLWVYGDGSGNTLTATVNDTAGGRSDVALTGLDFTGWKYVTAALPSGASGISALNVFFGGGKNSSGTLYLDQLFTSNEAVSDQTPPAVTASVTDRMLLATVSDAVTRQFTKDRVTVTWDGAAMDFTWNASVGTVSATLPADDGKLHRLTVTAVDLCGNIGRYSLDVGPTAQTAASSSGEAASGTQSAAASAPFSDMTAHWAEKYTTYLYDHSVTNGIQTGSGLQFQPDKNITRGEFFLMVSRWLGLDLDSYANVALPFTDAAKIADWALPGVKAMYALGVLKGSQDGSSLNVNTGSAISRAEAMAILGRIQPRGYAEPELTFDDTSSVPAWALSYVKSLVGQGVVGGYENKVNPSNSIKRGEVSKMLYTIL